MSDDWVEKLGKLPSVEQDKILYGDFNIDLECEFCGNNAEYKANKMNIDNSIEQIYLCEEHHKLHLKHQEAIKEMQARLGSKHLKFKY